jgi:hypothetical protein
MFYLGWIGLVLWYLALLSTTFQLASDLLLEETRATGETH